MSHMNKMFLRTFQNVANGPVAHATTAKEKRIF